MREKTLEQRVVRYCKARGLLERKLVSPGRSGVTDRIILGHGKVLFLELKAPGKKPAPLQEREIRLLQKHGMNAFWADNFETAQRVIDYVFGEGDLT